MQYFSYFFLFFLTALQLCDALLTMKIIKAGGRELNPFMARLINTLGLVPGLLAPKAAVVITAAAFLIPHPWIMFVLSLAYAYVVFHNWNQMVKKR